MGQFKTTRVGSSATAPRSAAASTAYSDLRVWGVLPAAQVILTTGYLAIEKMQARTKEQASAALARAIRKLKGRIKTITLDNGTEFHDYKSVEKKLGVKFYFANPYHSWERGTNENTNGLIRQYLPKGMDLKSLTQKKCNWIAKELNTRPRERLGFRTPAEALRRS